MPGSGALPPRVAGRAPSLERAPHATPRAGAGCSPPAPPAPRAGRGLEDPAAARWNNQAERPHEDLVGEIARDADELGATSVRTGIAAQLLPPGRTRPRRATTGVGRLFGAVSSAALACRASMHTAGRPSTRGETRSRASRTPQAPHSARAGGSLRPPPADSTCRARSACGFAAPRSRSVSRTRRQTDPGLHSSERIGDATRSIRP
jgi:hypothetical protein